ncbi:GDCCVxC domain-containing (seleno)protein [Alterinioella nitratireducens]|uniref:GDCCVxC domain-containing (seleno)protein n=1 Tax=Alterinioella nitratireducens TaxID=2735915 RepID=UPI004058AAB7
MATTPTIKMTTALTCPTCGQDTPETMPADCCVWFHECTGCGAILRPEEGDCCVFCSFGTVPCPPVQAGTPCC